MSDVTLVYPYFYEEIKDRSIFKFPPLGLGYLAAALEKAGHSVDLIDGSFMTRGEVVARIRKRRPELVGFYCMMTMEEAALTLAETVREEGMLIVAGGPYPSADPGRFLGPFDAVVIGEGEEAILDLAKAGGISEAAALPGLAYMKDGRMVVNETRPRVADLDGLAFPARHLFDNEAYKDYWRQAYGYTTTSMITTRGCPFDCGFCSKPVFGNLIKERSASNVVDEIEQIAGLGYDRIWMADDCFTFNPARISAICEDIIARKINVTWECLSRVDSVSPEMFDLMREAGCVRVFFGLESGDDGMLKKMKKNTTFAAGKAAVELAGSRGLKSGGFFILGYPGETDETLLKTVNLSSELPLDYLSYTVPYPLPGTDLYDKVKDRLKDAAWTSPRRHTLLYRGEFSVFKLKFAMAKGLTQRWLRIRSGIMKRFFEPLFRVSTDIVLRLIR